MCVSGCNSDDSPSMPAVDPKAEFIGSPRGGTVPLTVSFTDQSTSGSSAIISRSWSFGDGGTSTATNPSHAYSAAGTYTVSLAVTTAVGSDTEVKSNYITVSGVNPTAAFEGSPRSGMAPLTVSFTDQSTPGSSAIISRSWSFGDGGTSTATNPSHTYSSSGTYTVSLTVTTAVGSDTETDSDYIEVTREVVYDSAMLKLWMTQDAGDANIYAGRTTGSWSECSLTWNNKPSIDQDDSYWIYGWRSGGWLEFNITPIFNQWLSGSYSYSRGIVLFDRYFNSGSPSQNTFVRMYSGNWSNSSQRPHVAVHWHYADDPGTHYDDNMPLYQDTYCRQSTPTTNYCSSSDLYFGYLAGYGNYSCYVRIRADDLPGDSISRR